MTRRIEGLAEIEGEFDAVLVDQFGVLHDGHAAFPGAVECLTALARRGIPTVALSNSGKRAAPNLRRLERLGFPPALFLAVVTSGELAHGRVAAMLEDGRLQPGDGVAVVARDGDTSVISDLPLAPVRPEDAVALLLIAGAEPQTVSRESYRARLSPLARRGVPALCANPDRAMYANGRPGFGPGALAEDYRAAGGDAVMLGKPDMERFSAGLAALGDPAPSRCLMIGDSPEHDIDGARRAGCATLLISSGIQSGLAHAGQPPDYEMPVLRP